MARGKDLKREDKFSDYVEMHERMTSTQTRSRAFGSDGLKGQVSSGSSGSDSKVLDFTEPQQQDSG